MRASDSSPADGQASSGYYLIQISAGTSSGDDLAANLGSRNVGGHHAFSSSTAAETAAVLAREFERDLRPNFLFAPATSAEHPTDAGDFLDAEAWTWFSEDDDPTTTPPHLVTRVSL